MRTALQNASSIASLLLTTEALISRDSGGEEGRAGNAGRRRYGRDVLSRKSRKSEVRQSQDTKGPVAHASGPFLFPQRQPVVARASARCSHAPAGAWVVGRRSADYRSVNVNSMVICTGTAEPMRVPGAKRHWRAALMASWSRPNTESSDRRT